MIKTDKEGVPIIVQNWRYESSLAFSIKLFDGLNILVDMDNVRDWSCKKYGRWTQETDDMAINLYARDFYFPDSAVK